MKETLDLTLIVPCFNEMGHLEDSMEEILATLQMTRLNYEVLVIDDGSRDGTRELLKKLEETWANRSLPVRLIFNEKNLGRGATVTKGIRDSSARVVGFLDIDLSTQAVYIPWLVRLILSGSAQVASCRRIYKLDLSVIFRIWHRVVLSWGYRQVFRFVFRTSVRDSETGFKFFDRAAILPVVQQVEDGHWFWDSEVMCLAWLAGLRIVEVDSIYIRRPQKKSTVRIFRDVLHYLKNVVRLKKKLMALRSERAK